MAVRERSTGSQTEHADPSGIALVKSAIRTRVSRLEQSVSGNLGKECEAFFWSSMAARGHETSIRGWMKDGRTEYVT